MITGRSKSNTIISNQKLVKSFDFWKEKDTGPAPSITNGGVGSPPLAAREKDVISSKDILRKDADKRKSSSSTNLQATTATTTTTTTTKIPKLTTSLSSDNLSIPSSSPHIKPNKSFVHKDDTNITHNYNNSNNKAKVEMLESKLALEVKARTDLEKRIRKLEEELARSEAKQVDSKKLQKLNEEYVVLHAEYKKMEKELGEVKLELKEREEKIKSITDTLSKSLSEETEDDVVISNKSPNLDIEIKKKASSFNDGLRSSKGDTKDPYYARRGHTFNTMESLSESDVNSKRGRNRAASTNYNAEFLKQLIQQKYSSIENIRTPFIHNLRNSWRLYQSRNDSGDDTPAEGTELWESATSEDDSSCIDSPKTDTIVIDNGSSSSEEGGSPVITLKEDSPRNSIVLHKHTVLDAPGLPSSRSMNYLSDEQPMSWGASSSTWSPHSPYTIAAAAQARATPSDSKSSGGTTTRRREYDDDAMSTTSSTSDFRDSGSRQKGKFYGKIKSLFVRDESGAYDQDQFDDILTKRPTKQQLINKKILNGDIFFGVPLENFQDIPPIVEKIVAFLEEEFVRVPDLFINPGDEIYVNVLRRAFETQGDGITPEYLANQDPHVVATLLLKYLLSLPEKLLTVAYSPAFGWSHDVDKESLRYSIFRSLIFRLPLPNRTLLAYLLRWLRRVSDSESETLTAACLGEVFGPVLVHVPDNTKAANVVKKLIEDYKHVFMNGEPDIRFMMKEGRQVVKSGTVERLVEKLSDPMYKDDQYVDVFLLMHSYFTTNCELMAMLIDLYRSCKLGDLRHWKSETSRQILTVIKLWIVNYTERLCEDTKFVDLLNSFVNERLSTSDREILFLQEYVDVLSKPFSPPVPTRFSLQNTYGSPTGIGSPSGGMGSPPPLLALDKDSAIPEKTATNGAQSNSRKTPKSDSPVLTYMNSVNVDVVDLDPLLIAQQITLIDHQFLCAIPPHELLQKNHMDAKKSPNFRNMTNKFNEWGSWAITEILKKDTAQSRSVALTFFIDISKHCLGVSNFNACCAIMGGLNNAAVQRLKTTWEKVGKKTMKTYQEMMELFDMEMNSRNYRELLKGRKPPIIPYLGLIPKDLISAEELPLFLENKMCNFEKLRTLYRIIQEVKVYQEVGFPSGWAQGNVLQKLKNLKVLNDEEAYTKSLLWEPRAFE